MRTRGSRRAPLWPFLCLFLVPASLALSETPARAEIDAEFFGGGHFFNDNNPLGRGGTPIQATGLEHSGMLGLRLGYLPIPRLTLEGEIGLVPTSTHGTPGVADPDPNHVNIAMVAVRAHLLLNILTGRVRPFVLLGGGGQISLPAGTSVIKTDAEGEFHAGAGLKVDLVKDSWGLRLDGRAVFPQGITSTFTVEGEVLGSIYGRFDVMKAPPVPAAVVAEAAPPPPVAKAPPVKAPVVEPVKPPLDSDGDGILDTEDRCPKEAGPRENGGCPDKDTDGDGIVDRLDKCPNEPETKNGYQDDDGCPDEVPKALARFTGTIEGINFASGKSVILKSSYPVLDRAAAVLREHDSVGLEIAGHTDDTGDRIKNLELSQKRAEAVKHYLEEKGVAAGRLTAQGYGPDKPLSDNKSVAGRAKNRRVEFQLQSGAPIQTRP